MNVFDQFDDGPNPFDRFDPKPKRKKGVAEDSARSFAAGAMRGLASLGNTMSGGDYLEMGGRLGVAALEKFGALDEKQAEKVRDTFTKGRQAAGRRTTDEIVEPVGGNYKPETTQGKYARTAGEFLPNAIGPGGPLRAVARVAIPAVASEAAGQATEGTALEPWARAGGALAGGALANMRMPAGTPQEGARRILNTRAPQDPAAMRQRALEFRDAGIDPTLADVVDDSGRGAIRAAATRMTPGREAARDFAENRALDLPDRLGGQARRHMSADPRTPMQIADDLGTQRATTANREFGEVRGEIMQMQPETVQALRTNYGREAIAEAARRERDPAIRRELNALAENALDDPSVPITVGMADRISRTLFGRAQAATRGGDNDLASILNNLAESVRGPARQASPGYGAALQNYGAQSRMMESAERGEDFLMRNTDEFVDDVGRMAPDELTLARATGRRAVERAVGENPASAPGVARKLANAPEQQARNRALLGDQAPAFERGVRLEERAVTNANDINPRTGSRTAPNMQDAERMAGALEAGRNVVQGNWGGLAIQWLRSRGMSDRDAQALVQMSLNPQATDDTIRALEQQLGQDGARTYLAAMRNPALLTANQYAASPR